MKGIIENPDTGERFFDLKKILDSKPSCDDSGFVSGCKECCNPKIEHKELQLCASCNKARRKRETLASKPSKPIYRIPKTSAKRKAKLEVYTPLKKQYLLEHPECEIKLIGCEGKAVEIHHCSMSDNDFLNIDTWKGGCRHCHDQVERVLSAEFRREKGLLI